MNFEEYKDHLLSAREGGDRYCVCDACRNYRKIFGEELNRMSEQEWEDIAG